MRYTLQIPFLMHAEQSQADQVKMDVLRAVNSKQQRSLQCVQLWWQQGFSCSITQTQGDATTDVPQLWESCIESFTR